MCGTQRDYLYSIPLDIWSGKQYSCKADDPIVLFILPALLRGVQGSAHRPYRPARTILATVYYVVMRCRPW